MQFKKLPIIIDAIQWDGTVEGGRRIAEVFGDAVEVRWPEEREACEIPAKLLCATLEGHLQATPGDWIIRGVKGEVYPCKPDIFAATYELVE